MNEILELIKTFNFVKVGETAMSDETKNEAIEFLRFLIVFAGGYAKYMVKVNNIFNQLLNQWLIKLSEAGFSQRKLNGLALRFGYSLKTED